MSWNWLYVPPIALLLVLELRAAFVPGTPWETITAQVRRFERLWWGFRLATAALLVVLFTHLVLSWP